MGSVINEGLQRCNSFVKFLDQSQKKMTIMSNKPKRDGETIENLEAEKMSMVREKRKVELGLTDVRLFYENRKHEF